MTNEECDARDKLFELMKLAPSAAGLTDDEIRAGIDRNFEFTEQGAFRPRVKYMNPATGKPKGMN